MQTFPRGNLLIFFLSVRTHAEFGGAERFQEQRESGAQWAKNCISSSSKLMSGTSSFIDDQKIANMVGGITKHEKNVGFRNRCKWYERK